MPTRQVNHAKKAAPQTKLSPHGLMALRYAAMIGPVVPDFEILPSGKCACYGHRKHCKPGKHPRPRKGVGAATRDVFKITDWWLRNPCANVAICPDGFFVLEADAARGGLTSLERLEQEFGPFSVGPRSQSGGGGFHIYLKDAPDTHFVINPAEWPGLEIKAKGSKVTEYPSNHISGGSYRWLDGYGYDLPIPEPAEAFVKAFGRPGSSPSRPHTNNTVLSTVYVGKWQDGDRPYSFDLAKASTLSLASAVRLWSDLRPGEPFPAAVEKVRCFCPYHQNKDDEASAGFIVNLKDARVKLHCFATGKSWSMADWWAYAAHGVQLGALKPAWLNSWDRRLQRSQGLTGDPIQEMNVPDDYSESEKRVIRGLHERIMLEDGEPVCFEYQYGACWTGMSFSEFANAWKRLGKRDAITAIEDSSPKRYRLGGQKQEREAEEWFNRLVSWPWEYETDWLFHWDGFPEAVQTLSSLITARKALPEHYEPAPAVVAETQTTKNEESVCHAIRNSCLCGCGSPVNVEKGQKYVNHGHRMRAKRNQTKKVYALEGV